jgi:hypothetical protein
MTERGFFRGYGCPMMDFVQLEMVGTVPEIAPNGHLQWLTNVQCLFIHRMDPEISEDDDGNLFEAQPYRVAPYNKIANFEMYPHQAQFHAPDPGSICVLDSVRQGDLEQLAMRGMVEIFCGGQHGPIPVAWPMFFHENPLTFTFFNPLDRPLPSFNLSLFVEAPKDFASRWLEVCSKCNGRIGSNGYTVCKERDRGPLGDGNTYDDVRCRKCKGTGLIGG